MSDLIKTISFSALKPGPTLVVLGCIHGNEPCGRYAIEQTVKRMQAGELSLACGQLLMVPVCNPKAFAKGVRFVERNLNRHLYVKSNPKHYEDFIDPILCELLDRADVLLDLHSYASPGGPFIFLGGDDDAEQAYAYALGVNDFVYGWEQAFSAESGGEKGRLESMGTTEYVRAKGGISVTLECGQHANAENVAVGERAIVLALLHLGMIVHVPKFFQLDLEKKKDTARRVVEMKRVYYKKMNGTFAQSWRHFDRVSQGELLATFEDGEQIKANESGFIVLPKEFADVGGEWFYFGVEHSNNS